MERSSLHLIQQPLFEVINLRSGQPSDLALRLNQFDRSARRVRNILFPQPDPVAKKYGMTSDICGNLTW